MAEISSIECLYEASQPLLLDRNGLRVPFGMVCFALETDGVLVDCRTFDDAEIVQMAAASPNALEGLRLCSEDDFAAAVAEDMRKIDKKSGGEK